MNRLKISLILCILIMLAFLGNKLPDASSPNKFVTIVSCIAPAKMQ